MYRIGIYFLHFWKNLPLEPFEPRVIFLWRILITKLISSINIGLFRLSIFSFMSFDSLYFIRNFSISFKSSFAKLFHKDRSGPRDCNKVGDTMLVPKGEKPHFQAASIWRAWDPRQHFSKRPLNIQIVSKLKLILFHFSETESSNIFFVQ